MKKFKLKKIHYIGIIIFVIIISFAGFIMSTVKKPTKISYTEFIQLAKEKKIDNIKISLLEDKFVFKDNNDVLYETDNPKYSDFKKDLLELNLEVNEYTPIDIKSLLNKITYFSILLSLVYVSFKTIDGIKDKKGGKPISDLPKTKFEDIAGNKEVTKDVKFLVDFLKNHKKYKENGAKLPKGVILYGPPGTGKTLTAKAIAGESGVPFFYVSASNFMELYVGVGAKRVRNLFEEAKKNSPCIIFIDEIDAIGSKRGNFENDERRQTINALLTELDGFEENSGVLVITATNRIEDLDEALIRAGRFDKHIMIPLPATPNDRLEIIKLYAKNKKFSDDVSFDNLSKETIGFSGADIESLLNESAIISVQLNKDCIDKECIDKAIYQKLLKGHAKEDSLRDTEELKTVAYHEAGHALVAKLLTNIDVPKVTIVQSTSGAGGVTFLTPKKMSLKSIKDIKNEIKIAYGGRASEYILYKDEEKVTTGAYNDIQQATEKIKAFVTSYGMNKEIGMLNLNILNSTNQELILKECSKLAKELYEETLNILIENKSILDALACELLNSETITEDSLDKLIEEGKNNIKINKDTHIKECEELKQLLIK